MNPVLRAARRIDQDQERVSKIEKHHLARDRIRGMSCRQLRRMIGNITIE
jgi:hypothetical protein